MQAKVFPHEFGAYVCEVILNLHMKWQAGLLWMDSGESN
jgi:hypothetical protein